MCGQSYFMDMMLGQSMSMRKRSSRNMVSEKNAKNIVD